MHSGDSIHENFNEVDAFWGQIASTYNTIPQPGHERERKHLKVHWHACNEKVTNFNGIYIRLEAAHQSDIDDNMLLTTANISYREKFSQEFMLIHWWQAVR